MALITESGQDTLPLGAPGPNFTDLPSVDGKSYSLASFGDSLAITLIFTCNHCPYAVAYEQRLIDLAREFASQDIAFIAINVNDADNYPDDSFENMQKRAAELDLPFPYLYDETQSVAKAYGAVCTPHIFVLNDERRLAYEGRVDDSWKEPENVKSQDLRNALEALVEGENIEVASTNPMGCSIKWRV